MKLEGVKVLDLGMFLPAPVMSQILVDHGADVIRVEPPGGEPSRAFGPFDANEQSIWFKNTHRGKRSIALDLRKAEDLECLMRLVDEADVFIEGFRTGVAQRLGIGAQELTRRNPRLIYCSLTAFGQTGPLSPKGSHDMGAQAYTGFLSINDGGDGRPVVPGLPSADMAAALTGLAGILMALYRRTQTGLGDIVDACMYDALMPWTAHLSGPVIGERIPPATTSHRSIGGSGFYNVYQTADDRFIALTGREMKFATAFLTAMERPDLIPLAAEDPGAEQQHLMAELRAIFRQKTYAEWLTMLAGIDVSWAPVLDMVEAFDHPHARAREMLVDTPDGTVIGNPVRFVREPGRVALGAPGLDEHGAALREAGW